MTSGDGFIRIGKVKVTLADYYNLPALIKRAQVEDPYIAKKTMGRPNPFRQVGTASKIIPSNVEFSRMTNAQRANYLLHLRLTLQVADKIVAIGRTPAPKKTSGLFEPAESLWALLLRGDVACAASLAGQTCIVAGYLSKYDEKGRSCGGEAEGRADFVSQIQSTLGVFKATKCANGGSPSGPASFACNPIVYGMSSAGAVHCVPKANIKYATRECNAMSPLDKDGPKTHREVVGRGSGRGAVGRGLLQGRRGQPASEEGKARLDPRSARRLAGAYRSGSKSVRGRAAAGGSEERLHRASQAHV
jgi:hypothetical protein